jgi:hypothetical protein
MSRAVERSVALVLKGNNYECILLMMVVSVICLDAMEGYMILIEEDRSGTDLIRQPMDLLILMIRQQAL